MGLKFKPDSRGSSPAMTTRGLRIKPDTRAHVAGMTAPEKTAAHRECLFLTMALWQDLTRKHHGLVAFVPENRKGA
jgi:hypothetical protein